MGLITNAIKFEDFSKNSQNFFTLEPLFNKTHNIETTLSNI